jgi:eukaryotic-like serine/threonine-protein kinase
MSKGRDGGPTRSQEPPAHHGLGERPGDWIGPYKLLEIIGEGGFGTVWLAERREPIVQRVALKIIKAGMDTRTVVARFEQERQALAVMDHPLVAKVFDAGATPAGRPYFVMEHVAGEPITEYADRHNLTVRQRLELFIGVCEAVQHAHLKGIIHRDIKPSNILVSVRDGRPSPKVIDFGIAKAITHTLTDKTIFTETGHLIGTPEYMSPEQAEMGATDIDTRTDVYSLGVVLYELLSGLLPFDAKQLRGAGYAAICRILRDEDPPKPSTRLSTADPATSHEIAHHRQAARDALAEQLRRELDWIPLKAMRKDRTLRYQTPSDLARDLHNYLEGKPLEAGPESAAYRLRKFIRRKRGPVLAVSVVILALLLGLAGTLWQAGQATKQAHRADDRAAEALIAQATAQQAVAEQKRLREVADTRAAEAKAAQKNAEFEAYFANLNAAKMSLNTNEIASARRRLDACPEYLRGWEWGWLNARSDSSLVVLREHQDILRYAEFSPDGTRVVTASDDGTAGVWDVATGKKLAVLHGHRGAVTSAAFSPDGTRVVTASYDGSARVWDAATGGEMMVLRGDEGPVTSTTFSPDGMLIVTASFDQTARLWDSATGRELAVLRGHEERVFSAAFSSDGTRVVTASYDQTARVWDTATGKVLSVLHGHEDWVTSAAFSPDGMRVVTASTDGTAQMWDAATGKELMILRGHTGSVTSAVFSPDGMRIVTASYDKTARVWYTATGNELAVLRGDMGSVTSAAFSPDGMLIVTASSDKTARVWDTATGKELAVLRGHESWVTSAAFNPDGTRVVTASEDETARVWDTATGKEPAAFSGHKSLVTSAAFNPDGMRVVTASKDETARVWDVVTGEELAVLRGHIDRVNSAAFSPDGSRVVTASDDGTAGVWDVATGRKLAVLRGHEKGVTFAAFSPDGTRMVTASKDETARVWDVVTGRELVVLRGHEKGVTAAAFSPDGTQVVTASRGETAWVWDAVTGKKLAGLHGHESWVTSAAFSPDGRRVVTASFDGTARVWYVATGKELAVLRGHESSVTAAAFSPDGTQVVTASWDETARVWDAATGKELAGLRGHENTVSSAAFSPDGTRVVTASGDQTARVWDAATGKELAILRGNLGSLDSAAFSPDGTLVVTASGSPTARVWNSVSYRERFPAIQRARLARKKMAARVRAQMQAGKAPETIRTEALADPALTPEQRFAIYIEVHSILEARLEQTAANRDQADRLNSTVWNSVRFAPVTEADARRAVEDTRKAMDLAPDNADILNTLGVALFRAGQFDEALATLTRTAAVHDAEPAGPQPADWVFLAMTHWNLGHEAQARSALAKVRTMSETERWTDDEEMVRWIEELDDLIPDKP